MNQFKKKLQALDQQKNNSMYRFGPKTPELVDMIERNARVFHQKPIGPVGKYKYLIQAFIFL